jgi:hypothetical protein
MKKERRGCPRNKTKQKEHHRDLHQPQPFDRVEILGIRAQSSHLHLLATEIN